MSRRPDFSSRPQHGGKRAADVGLLFAGVLALAASSQASWSAWAGIRRAAAETDRVRAETQRATERTRALQSGRGAGEILASRALLSAEAPPPRVLADLEAILPRDVRLDGLSLAYGETLVLDMTVAARHGRAYDDFLRRLGESPLFADVVPQTEARDGELRATIRARYNGVAGS